ncbi:MAG: hypothetical protein BYD32DRAFT_429319 [Podila humilis]|nr:MAG: hypothetical protein BYD32DRAFT_429319 [Podila humilis]
MPPTEDNGPLDETSPHQPATPISFADLLFDSILMQQSRTKGKLHQDSRTQIDITYIVDAFKVALRTCSVDQVVAKVSTAATFGKALEDAKLDKIDHVRNYVVQRKGANGIFPKDMITIPDEKVLKHFWIPIADPPTSTLFEDSYAKAARQDMEMVALIMYQIRTQLDAETLHARDLNRKLGLAVDLFSPRYFGQRAFNKRKESEPSSNIPTQESKVQAAIDQFVLEMKKLQVHSATMPTYGLQGQLDLPTALVTDKVIDVVTTAADVLFKVYSSPSERYIARRSDLVQRIQKIIDSTYPGCQLRIEEYGSSASGLGSDISDVDLCITRDNFDRSEPYGNLENMIAALQIGGMTKVLPLLHTRVPIITFVDPVSRIDCDICCNEMIGVYGSKLIGCYARIDPRVKPLMYNVKALVKAHGINDASQGFFSTFAYMIMIIGFLQAQEPPILPSLQAQPRERVTEQFVQKDDGKDGQDIDCSFDQDVDRYKDFGAANTKPVGQLLIEFFEFYCRYFDYRSLEIDVHLGGFRTREEVSKRRALGHKELSTGHGEKKLYVVDPFTGRNVTGKCGARHLTQIWRTFQWVYCQLSQGHHQQALAPIPESYFRFEAQIIEHIQKQAANTALGASAPTFSMTT